MLQFLRDWAVDPSFAKCLITHQQSFEHSASDTVESEPHSRPRGAPQVLGWPAFCSEGTSPASFSPGRSPFA